MNQGGREFRFGLLLVLVAVLIWGGQLPVAKNAMRAIDGYSMSVVRYGVAVVLFMQIGRVSCRERV